MTPYQRSVLHDRPAHASQVLRDLRGDVRRRGRVLRAGTRRADRGRGEERGLGGEGRRRRQVEARLERRRSIDRRVFYRKASRNQ